MRGTYGQLLTEGARFAAAPGEQGLFWLLEATVKDGRGTIAGQKLVGVMQPIDGDLDVQDPLILLDFEPLTAPVNEFAAPALPDTHQPLAAAPKTIEAWAKSSIIDPYLEQLRTRRQHEGNVRETYLQRSLDTLIADQTAKIMRYADDDKARRRDAGQWDIGLRTLEQTLEEYQARLKRRMDESWRMRAVGADAPRIVGVCAFVPAPDVLAGDDEGDDPVTEDIAVAIARQYERDNNRTPRSVEADGLGFDLRSIGSTRSATSRSRVARVVAAYP